MSNKEYGRLCGCQLWEAVAGTAVFVDTAVGETRTASTAAGKGAIFLYGSMLDGNGRV